MPPFTKQYNDNTRLTISALTTIGYIPDIIVLAKLNFPVIPISTRYSMYTEQWPNAKMHMHHNKLPQGCAADFKNCGLSETHTCTPGPILRYSEEFGRTMIFMSHL